MKLFILILLSLIIIPQQIFAAGIYSVNQKIDISGAKIISTKTTHEAKDTICFGSSNNKKKPEVAIGKIVNQGEYVKNVTQEVIFKNTKSIN